MTTHKHLKGRVRARMAQTGERYAAARRNVVNDDAGEAGRPRADAGRTHGIHPETSALRSALADLGATAPHTGEPWSEEMLLGLGGGIGMGTFAFHYAAADFSSFYLGARHLWDDSAAFLREAAARVGAPIEVLETGSARTAATQLRDVLASGRAAIASVDLEALGYRGLPAELGGGGYHHVRVRAFDATAGTALVEDLRAEPIELTAETLERARARIKSQRHRLFAVGAPVAGAAPALEVAVREALLSTASGLDGSLDPAAGGRRGRNFSLDGLAAWAKRLHGDRSAEGWARMFPPGHRLWRGLGFVYEFIEHFGSGGGLLRPMYARYLREAGDALGSRELAALGDRYDALGRAWSELAAAALPADVAPLAETTRLIARREASFLEAGPAGAEEIRAIWGRLAEIEAGMHDSFPLSGEAVDELLAGLQQRVLAIESGERAAVVALREAAAAIEGGRG